MFTGKQGELMVRVLVCGGRTFGEFGERRNMSAAEIEARSAQVLLQRNMVRVQLYRICDEYHCWSEPDQYGNRLPIDITVIHGGAKGADRLADEWAVVNWLPIREIKADWQTHGLRAGMIRNLQMIEEEKPDVVLAFPGGRGTANMVQQALAHRIRVIEIDHQGNSHERNEQASLF